MGYLLGNTFGVPKIKMSVYKSKEMWDKGLIFKMLPKNDPTKVYSKPHKW